MRNVYFLRHCKTKLNSQQRISGTLDSELEGGASIKNFEQIQDKNVVVLSSDLLRCKKTVELLKDKLVDTTPIYYYSSLRERNMGFFEGKKREELQKEYPQYFSNGRFCYKMTPPNGEEFNKVLKRVNEFAENELIKKFSQKNVVICGHNQVLKFLWCELMNRQIEEVYANIDFVGGKVTRVI